MLNGDYSNYLGSQFVTYTPADRNHLPVFFAKTSLSKKIKHIKNRTKKILKKGDLADNECERYERYEVSTPMRCIAPIEVVSKTERSSEKYLQELPVKGFVLEAVPLSSFEHKTDEPYAGRANKGLFTKPPIHWQMMPKEYFGLCFAFKARA